MECRKEMVVLSNHYVSVLEILKENTISLFLFEYD